MSLNLGVKTDIIWEAIKDVVVKTIIRYTNDVLLNVG